MSGLLVTPGVSGLSALLVLIKDRNLSLRPRLRVLVPPCCVHRDSIRMISEGSCDIEDWSNDAENLALITGINCILT